MTVSFVSILKARAQRGASLHLTSDDVRIMACEIERLEASIIHLGNEIKMMAGEKDDERDQKETRP